MGRPMRPRSRLEAFGYVLAIVAILFILWIVLGTVMVILS